MKKNFVPVTTSENYNIMPLAEEATDYSKIKNWMYCGSYDDKFNDNEDVVKQKHEVDLLYFYPTVTQKADDGLMCSITDKMRDSAHYAFADTGSVFSEYTNVFAPYYTQLPIAIDNTDTDVLKNIVTKEKLANLSLSELYKALIAASRVRTDVYAALDYYFENFNNGRPFIIAGHSQGSAVTQIILSEYMRVHPEYLKNMVAAYSIGFAISKKWLKENQHLKFATGEKDTGCIISYTTEGPGEEGVSVLTGNDAISINPLNWRLDDTFAGPEKNKGKLVQDHTTHSWSIEKGTADACINLERGTVVCTTNEEYETNAGMGHKSLHTYDYAEYYMNLRENGKIRCAEFLGHEIK